MNQFKAGDLFRPMVLVLTSAGLALTGSLTITVRVWRASDKQLWDFGGTPQFRASGWTTVAATLTEVDSSNLPGWYYFAAGVDTTGFSATDYYCASYADTALAAGNLPADERFQIQAVFATVATNLNATVGSRAAAGDAMALTSGERTSTAEAFLDTALSGHTSAGTAGAALANADVITSSRATSAQILSDATPFAGADVAVIKADVIAAMGTGFTPGTDDLHSAHATQAAGATASALATLQSTANTINVAVSSLPSASANATAVASTLASAHGAGSWLTADVSALALESSLTSALGVGFIGGMDDLHALRAAVAAIPTGAAPTAADVWAYGTRELTGIGSSGIASSTNVTDAATALANYGDAHWVTATGFSVAGDLMGLADGAITASKFAANSIAAAALTADAIAAIQAGLASQASLDAATLEILAIEGAGFSTGADSLHAIRVLVSALPTPSTISTQVIGDLETAHGTGPWTTADVSALATTVDLAAARTSIEGSSFDTSTDSLHALRARGDSAWTTADVSSLATTVQLSAAITVIENYGDVHWVTANIAPLALETTLTAIKGSGWGTGDNLHAILVAIGALEAAPTSIANAAAVWATAESMAAPGTVLYDVTLARKALTNKLTEAAGAPGTLVLMDDDTTTPIKTWMLLDGTGAAVVTGAGEPARRSAAT